MPEQSYWASARRAWPIGVADVPLAVDRAALVLIDMQRYWTDPGGPLARKLRSDWPAIATYFYGRLGDQVVPSLARVLAAARRGTVPVVHVTTGQERPDGSDMPRFMRRRIADDEQAAGIDLLAVDAPWHAVAEPLAPRAGELVVNKRGRSAFTSTGIDHLLRNLAVEHVLIGGILTEGCVELTARDAADRGYEVFLLEDGCATYADDVHRAAVRAFARLSGQVLACEHAVTAIDGHAARG